MSKPYKRAVSYRFTPIEGGYVWEVIDYDAKRNLIEFHQPGDYEDDMRGVAEGSLETGLWTLVEGREEITENGNEGEADAIERFFNAHGPPRAWNSEDLETTMKPMPPALTLAEHQALMERAGQAAHEVNRCYCIAIGDQSQPHWHDAPQWQRDSAIEGARACFLDPSRSPGASHAGWLQAKHREGWVWGAEKDGVRKVHPCMVPYEDLPEHQKAKDALFIATCRGVFSYHAPQP
jgi:hypothetical protein